MIEIFYLLVANINKKILCMHNIKNLLLFLETIKPNEFYPEDTIMFYGETLKTLEDYSYHTEVEKCLYYH